MPPNADRPLRVLIVDDSAFNRRSISELLATSPEVEVVGRAADGEEALRLVGIFKPDAITLDLEMPRMDGFTFLRILMSKMPTPVIVVSSYSQKENVFKALELGALDFVAKPDRHVDAELTGIRDELVRKVLLARSLKAPAPPVRSIPAETPAAAKVTKGSALIAPQHVVAIASSTGGPSALMEVLSRIPATTRATFLIAQHMPDKFTRTFAERLNRRSAIFVDEAQDRDGVGQGMAMVCPGRRCMTLEATGGAFHLRVVPPVPDDRYIPSADRLMHSVAVNARSKAIGVILTGMGDDGVRGARRILEAGGTVIAESEQSAVVYGMPGSAVRAGVVSSVLALPEIAEFLAALPGG